MFEAIIEIRGLARSFKFSTEKIDRAIARALGGPKDPVDEHWDKTAAVGQHTDGTAVPSASIPTEPTDSRDELVRELEDYILFVDRGNKDAIGLAWVHGWRCPQQILDEGDARRSSLNQLREMVARERANRDGET